MRPFLRLFPLLLALTLFGCEQLTSLQQSGQGITPEQPEEEQPPEELPPEELPPEELPPEEEPPPEELPPEEPPPEEWPEEAPPDPCDSGALLSVYPAANGIDLHVDGQWWSSELGQGTITAMLVPAPEPEPVYELIGVWHTEDGWWGGALSAVVLPEYLPEPDPEEPWGEPEPWPEELYLGWLDGAFFDEMGELVGLMSGSLSLDEAGFGEVFTSWSARVGDLFAEYLQLDPMLGELFGGVFFYDGTFAELYGQVFTEPEFEGWAWADLVTEDGLAGWLEGPFVIEPMWGDPELPEPEPMGFGWFGGEYTLSLDPELMMVGAFEAEVMVGEGWGEVYGSLYAPTCVPADPLEEPPPEEPW